MASAMTEERYKQLVEYVRGARRASQLYPPGFTSNEKRALHQQAATFEEKDSVLFHSSKGPNRKLYYAVLL